MMNGVQIDPVSFLAWHLCSVAISTIGLIVGRGLITSIARCLGVESNLEERVLGSGSLIKSFE